jgi:hypothetical protein
MRPDLVLRQAHQARHDGHPLFDIIREILSGGDGFVECGRFMSYPRRT